MTSYFTKTCCDHAPERAGKRENIDQFYYALNTIKFSFIISHFHYILTIISFIEQCGARAPEHSGNYERIVHGFNATDGAWPWQVALFHDGYVIFV